MIGLPCRHGIGAAGAWRGGRACNRRARPSLADPRRLAGAGRRTVAGLNAMGIGRGDRVALVLPNGPEAASSFVTVACGATTAPLNPGYKADEFAFYLGDTGARGADVLAGWTRRRARRRRQRGIPVVELVPDATGRRAHSACCHRTGMTGSRGACGTGEAGADDVALILHTSGTTSRPKIVPLRHVNVTASAYNIGAALALGPDDVCMNIMPLFHIHGLIAATLASLAAGGAVSCTPGFNAFRFYAWFEQVRPTWYTAVPTMHQTILELAPRHKPAIAAGRLRFIRSSSSSLPAPGDDGDGGGVRRAGDRVLRHDRGGASDGVQPAAAAPTAFPGCVGVAAGPEVAIMDEAGNLLPPGELRRGGDPRPQRHRGIREQPSRQCRGLHQRLVPHRRPGRAGRATDICG